MKVFERLISNATAFPALTGMERKNFAEILKKLEKLWQYGVLERYRRPGRNAKLTLPEMLFVTLVYCHCYVTYDFIAALAEVDAATIGRIIRRIEMLLVGVICHKKVQELTTKKVKQIIADARQLL
jgi:hypothetical protein